MVDAHSCSVVETNKVNVCVVVHILWQTFKSSKDGNLVVF